MRRRFNRASWTYCDQCGKAETKIAKSIHGGIVETCCGKWIFRKSKPISHFNFQFSSSMNMQKQIEEIQISYGIAWGVE